jgi:hypothetical protein
VSRNAILAAVALAAVLLALIFLPPLRMAVIVPALMLLPGYVITAAVVPGRLDVAEQLILSLVLSLTFAILVGLALGAVGIPIQQAAWWVALGVIGLVAAAMAVRRRGRPSEPIQMRLPYRREVVLLLCAGLIVVIAIEISSVGARDARTAGDESVPVLWLLPESERERDLSVGIRNIGSLAGTYRLTVVIDGSPFRTFDVALEGRAEWSAPLEVGRSAKRIDALLYIPESVQPVRHVWRALPSQRSS